ncbi:MAG TPA: 50S ribosomal protein L21 [Terriglobales bacterium]|nr:50S ribosomal protein L21 [Terriglobales bacterium]
MYAVIRAGGKQYRVAPGDVIRIEKSPATNGKIEFTDVLAVSGQEGQIGRPQGDARVVGSVVEEGRADKILVFHFKRKKQYKKLAGHRQPFTAIRITEIAFDGQKFTAPDQPKPEKKAKPAPAHAEHAEAKHEKKHAAPHAEAKKHAPAKHKKPAPKKADHKKKK